MHTQSSSLFNSPLEAGGRISGDGDVGVPGTPIHVDVLVLGHSPITWIDPGLATWGSRLTSAAASTQGQIFTPADVDSGRCVEIVLACEIGDEVIPAPNNDASTAVAWTAARQAAMIYLGGAPIKPAGSSTRGTNRPVGAPVLVRGGGDSDSWKDPAVTQESTGTKRVYFGGESSINKTGKGWRAAAADCLGLTLQVMWKLTSLELVGFNLAVLLKQPWLISFLVVACFLGAQALARARDARKPGDGRNRFAQGRASAASPRQKTSLRLEALPPHCVWRRCRPTASGGAAAPLRPVLMLCLVSAASAVRLATNLACLPYEAEEVFLDFSGVRACCSSQRDSPALTLFGRALWRRLNLAAQQPGRAGREGWRRRFAGARMRGADPKRRLLASDGCVAPQNAVVPKGSGRPHRAPLSPCVRSLRKRHQHCGRLARDGHVRRAGRPVGRDHHAIPSCGGAELHEGCWWDQQFRRDQPERAWQERSNKQCRAQVHI